jgi:hypothetical protein
MASNNWAKDPITACPDEKSALLACTGTAESSLLPFFFLADPDAGHPGWKPRRTSIFAPPAHPD